MAGKEMTDEPLFIDLREIGIIGYAGGEFYKTDDRRRTEKENGKSKI